MSPNHTKNHVRRKSLKENLTFSWEGLLLKCTCVYFNHYFACPCPPLPTKCLLPFFPLLSFGNCLFSPLFFPFMVSMPHFSGSEWAWPSLPSSESSSRFTHVPQSQFRIVTFLFILQLLSTFYLHHHLAFLCSLHHSAFYRSRYWYWRVPLVFPPYLYICSPSLLESMQYLQIHFPPPPLWGGWFCTVFRLDCRYSDRKQFHPGRFRSSELLPFLTLQQHLCSYVRCPLSQFGTDTKYHL